MFYVAQFYGPYLNDWTGPYSTSEQAEKDCKLINETPPVPEDLWIVHESGYNWTLSAQKMALCVDPEANLELSEKLTKE